MTDLNPASWAFLCLAVLAVAFCYSSVGHGGATGYLAALSLLGVAPASARVAVLIANVLVAGIAWWRFNQAGHFRWRPLLLLSLGSVPCAVLGSRIHIDLQTYKLVLGSVLVAAGLVLLLRAKLQAKQTTLKPLAWPLALVAGAVLGFLAGLTGIGGGVFLSPLLLFLHWVEPKTTGGIAAGFIVLNSIAGLIGSGWDKLVHAGPLLWLTVPAVAGAVAGTYLGARRWSNVTFSRVLAAVLVFAGGKLLLETLS